MTKLYEDEELKIILTKKYAERFWKKTKEMPNECVEWQGAKIKAGYGQVKVGKKNFRTHQVAYLMANGKPLPKVIRHSCNNTKCCNPSHLYDGTHTENMDDMFAALRHPSQKEEKEMQIREAIKKLTFVERELLFHIIAEEFKLAPQG